MSNYIDFLSWILETNPTFTVLLFLFIAGILVFDVIKKERGKNDI